MAGFPLLDPIGGLLVSGLIVKVGAEIALDSFRDLTDTLSDPKEPAQFGAVAENVPGVLSVHRLRTRPIGGRVICDMTIW